MNVEELTVAASMAGVALGAAVATYVRVAGRSTDGKLATGAQSFADLRKELSELRDRIARLEGRLHARLEPGEMGREQERDP